MWRYLDLGIMRAPEGWIKWEVLILFKFILGIKWYLGDTYVYTRPQWAFTRSVGFEPVTCRLQYSVYQPSFSRSWKCLCHAIRGRSFLTPGPIPFGTCTTCKDQYFCFPELVAILRNLHFECKIQKNWCTVTVAPTIEHHGGHSWTPENQRWDQVPGRSQRLLLG